MFASAHPSESQDAACLKAGQARDAGKGAGGVHGPLAHVAWTQEEPDAWRGKDLGMRFHLWPHVAPSLLEQRRTI